MGIDDAARAAKDRLDMVGRDDEPVIINAEEVVAMAQLLDEEPDVCDQVGMNCRDCEEVLYHPHERQLTISEVQAKKILWELGQLAIDSAEVGTDLRDRDRLQALITRASVRVGHIIHETG